MTVLAAAKIVVVLGCLSDPKDVWPINGGLHCQGIGSTISQCAPQEAKPEDYRRAADGMEWNMKREKECPKAKEELRKAVEESK